MKSSVILTFGGFTSARSSASSRFLRHVKAYTSGLD